MAHNPHDDLDKILRDLKSEYKEPNISNNTAKSSSNSNKIDDLLKQLKSDIKSNTPPITNRNEEFKSNKSKSNHDLDSIKAEYQKKQNWQKSQERLNLKRNQQEIVSQEQQKQLQRKQLSQKAKTWLANLDPISEEGMWFNQLAESYPSQLDAAIDYLSTLKSDF